MPHVPEAHGDAADGPPPHAASARAAAERRRRPAAASVCRARAVGRRRAIVALWQHWRRALSLRGRGVARGAAASPRRGGRCAHVGRPHHSNYVMLTVDLMNGLAFQRCYDHQCVVRLPGGGYRKARTFVGEVPAALARRCRAVLENCSSTITSLGSNLSSLNMGKQTPAPLQCSQYTSLETTPGPTRHDASTRAHTPLYDTHTVQFQHPLLGRRRRIRTRAARGRSASRPAPSSSEVRASTRADETAASRARTETAQPRHAHLVAAFGRAQRVEQLDLQQYRELRR